MDSANPASSPIVGGPHHGGEALALSETELDGVGAAERRAWQLATAAVGPSERVAAELERAGLAARNRASHASAARAFERAAQLTPAAEQRARRLLAAAGDAQLAGRFDWAASCLGLALSATADPDLRVEIRHLWGVVERFRGSTERACGLFLDAASEIEAQDRCGAALLVSEAAGTCLVAGKLRTAEALLERAEELVPGGDHVAAVLTSTVREVTSLLRGRRPPPTQPPSTVEGLLRAKSLPPSAFALVIWMITCLTRAEHYGNARSLYEEMIDRARSQSRLGALPMLLLAIAELELRMGAWTEAAAHLREAAGLATDSSQASVRAASAAYLGRIEGALGHEQECRRHLGEAEALAVDFDAGLVLIHVRAARGLLELGLGNIEAALAELEATRRATEESGLGHPGVVPFEPDLIEAYWRSGEREKAGAALAVLERKAKRSGSSWARAAALRCRGMLGPADEAARRFEEALREHSRTTTPFDRARTELCFGERLRRERRRADARPHLRAALEAFERLGAEPWAERARAELGATAAELGRHSGGTDGSGGTGDGGVDVDAGRAQPGNGGLDADLDELTPQELQVARIVAEGATNKEAAATLFVSPKTIDAHLQHIYRKLGLRSRTELAHLLAQNNGNGGNAEKLAGAAQLPAAPGLAGAPELPTVP